LCVAQISRHSDLRRESAALEAIDAAVELGVPEDRLDQRLAAPIQRLAEIGLQDAAHERVAPAVPARPAGRAVARVGRDQDLSEQLANADPHAPGRRRSGD